MASTRAMRWLLGALLATSGCASQGVIHGTVTVPRARQAGLGAHAGHAAPKAGPQDAIVYLEKVPDKVEATLARAPQAAVVAQENHRFVPRVVPVVAGSTVRFENRDRVYHNVFSVAPTKRFDVGKYAPGKFKEVRFDSAGVIQLFCDIDPAMSGYVVVLPHHAFARPDAMGAFTLPRLPRGTYTVKVWHPNLGRLSRKVEMPKRGDAQVDLRY